MASRHVDLSIEDGIASVTLDAPTRRNALSGAMLADLAAAFDAALADPTLRVIVLTHTGPVFCAGMDLRESLGASSAAQSVRTLPRVLDRILTARVPVVARVAGAARGGGVGLVAACDIVVASEDATFAFSEVRLGLVPAVVSDVVLQRMDPRRAQELFLTGETFDAARAELGGLVTRAVARDGLDAEVDRYVAMLLRGAPDALAATKALVVDGVRTTPDAETRAARVERLLELSALHFASPEGQEGMRAFAERRSPGWVRDSGP